GGVGGSNQVVACKAEVHHLHVSMPGQHDIPRLDIPMDNVVPMCFRHRFRDFGSKPENFIQWDRTFLHSRLQSLPLYVFQNEECLAVDFFDFVCLADEGVVHRGSGTRLSLNEITESSVLRGLGCQELQSNTSVESGILCQVDLPHSALPKAFKDEISGDFSA